MSAKGKDYTIFCRNCGSEYSFMDAECPVCGYGHITSEFEKELLEFDPNGMHIENFAATFAEV